MRLLATSSMERKWRAQSCKKEPWTVAWIEESMSAGGVLYDVGANVGAFSLIAAKVCARRGTVVAFEPGFASYAHLCANIVLNRCESIIVPLPVALGSTNGLAAFVSHPGSRPEPASIPSAGLGRRGGRYEKRALQPVLSMTLDSMIQTFGLPQPHHLKLTWMAVRSTCLEGPGRLGVRPAVDSDRDR